MTKTEVSKLFATLTAAFPNGRYTEQTAQVYESMLADLDYQLGQMACRRLIATAKFLPTIAEIRAAAVELQLGPKRVGGEAWGDVVREIRRTGSYGSPTFEDPLVARCVADMGWKQLCLSDNDVADRARFVALYEALDGRHRLDAVAGDTLALPAPRGGGLRLIGAGK